MVRVDDRPFVPRPQVTTEFVRPRYERLVRGIRGSALGAGHEELLLHRRRGDESCLLVTYIDCGAGSGWERRTRKNGTSTPRCSSSSALESSHEWAGRTPCSSAFLANSSAVSRLSCQKGRGSERRSSVLRVEDALVPGIELRAGFVVIGGWDCQASTGPSLLRGGWIGLPTPPGDGCDPKPCHSFEEGTRGRGTGTGPRGLPVPPCAAPL